ncbi:hypothetical protein ACYZTL_24215 [Pseudomonas sp. LB3P81]
MPILKNFVAVDWRSGKDAIHFFFKDTETYSRFNVENNEVPGGYPTSVYGRWDTFAPHVKDLRFGFTVTGLNIGIFDTDVDVSYLFYADGDTPMVCEYNQDTDKVISKSAIKHTPWSPILPYFGKIVAGTWWESYSSTFIFRFILNDGSLIQFDYKEKTLKRIGHYRPEFGLERFKGRIITAAQYDQTFNNSLWYIFLTNNQYVVYNIFHGYVAREPHDVNDGTWPGLLRN